MVAAVLLIVIVLAGAALLMGRTSGGGASSPLGLSFGGAHAKSVILLVGDGMGFADLTAARWEESGRDLSNYSSTSLAMDRMAYSGRVRTSAADALVPDSAASITALLCGEKTNRGVIGQDATAVMGVSDGAYLNNIAELARKEGRATGVVTSSRITHATPAGVYAHVNDRGAELGIARQLLGSGIDVALGGGYRYFLGDTRKDPWGNEGRRGDGRDLIEEARVQGYTVVTNASALGAVHATPGAKVLGLFDTSSMEYELKRAKSEEPSLAEMTGKAVEILATDRDGFVLMVEGGQIDSAASARDYKEMVGETLAFDDAVKTALAFAERNPETLVIVTADHEAGGLILQGAGHGNMTGTIASGSELVRNGTGAETGLAFEETATHTAVDVPIMASGPGADRFGQGIDNTQVFVVLRELMGL